MMDVEEVEGRKASKFGSLSATSLTARINELESQMLDEKLILLGDDGKLQRQIFDGKLVLLVMMKSR